jgi:thioredoxin 1
MRNLKMHAIRGFTVAGLLLALGCQRPLPPPTDNPYLRKLLDTDQPVLLDCWAEWCGPCRQLAPVIEQLAGEYRGRAVVAKLDIDEQPEVAEHLGISAIPALLFFKDGKLVQRMTGVQPKSTIAASLDELLGDDS